jgi:hypothetical protein
LTLADNSTYIGDSLLRRWQIQPVRTLAGTCPRERMDYCPEVNHLFCLRELPFELGDRFLKWRSFHGFVIGLRTTPRAQRSARTSLLTAL